MKRKKYTEILTDDTGVFCDSRCRFFAGELGCMDSSKGYEKTVRHSTGMYFRTQKCIENEVKTTMGKGKIS